MKFYQNRAAEIASLRTQGWRVVTFKNSSLVVAYIDRGASGCSAKAWRGKADKPAWHYSFRDAARLEVYVKDFAAQVEKNENYRANKKAATSAARASLKAFDHWSVGDVIYNSWGYDQTNIDFYQVIEVKAKSIVIREVTANSSDVGGPSGGRTAPRRNEFTSDSKPLLKPCDERGHITFRHGAGCKWDGRALGCSSYH